METKTSPAPSTSRGAPLAGTLPSSQRASFDLPPMMTADDGLCPWPIALPYIDDERIARLTGGHSLNRRPRKPAKASSGILDGLAWLSPAIIAVAYFGWQFAR